MTNKKRATAKQSPTIDTDMVVGMITHAFSNNAVAAIGVDGPWSKPMPQDVAGALGYAMLGTVVDRYGSEYLERCTTALYVNTDGDPIAVAIAPPGVPVPKDTPYTYKTRI